ncbi:4,5-DOPA dioxygenase extradiol-like [Pomacea canaliculata]|uniref:4,5-DOPA dioxygenase extradiol-like n=1 Tax=Pomacea canaliculata TaxID=400727 RepID=UPI000D72EBA4|nr:4,5-DOPA dioxygenase extradiol-like [Pomacea canaliculata]
MRFAVILTCRVLSIGFVSLAVAQHIIASSSSCPRTAMSSQKQPVLFLSHGGGPSFFLSASDSPFLSGMDKDSDAARYLRELAQKEKLNSHKAVLVVSAHWEESDVTIQTTKKPDLYFDYYGFPPETYKLTWPAVGAPDLAKKIQNLLECKGIKCKTNSERGYDHGVFVPFKLIFPDPKVPVFQLSLDSSLDPEVHLRLGEALQELREEGILIVGSGFTTHRMRPSSDPDYGKKMQEWLHNVLTNPQLTPSERRKILVTCDHLPAVQEAHPRTEHLLPFLVTMAAAEYNSGRILFSASLHSGWVLEHYIFDS